MNTISTNQTPEELKRSNTYCANELLKSMRSVMSEYISDEEPNELSCPQYEGVTWYLPEMKKETTMREIPTNIQTLVFSSCCASQYTWMDLENLPENIETIWFGHDGLCEISFIFHGMTGEQDEKQIHNVLQRLPKLKKIYYCGYYNSFEKPLKKVIKNMGRDVTLSKIY